MVAQRSFPHFSNLLVLSIFQKNASRPNARSQNIAVYWAVGAVVEDIAVCPGGLGFDFRSGQIKHSVANGSPPLQCFCLAQALSRGDDVLQSLRALMEYRECNEDLICL